MPVTTKDKTWELLHSLWIGWTFTLGLFNWIAFIYIGLRTNQRKWILWGVLYAIPITFVFFLIAADASAGWGAIAVLSTFVAGIASIFHAFMVRKEYLVRLEALLDGAQANNRLLKQRLGNDPHSGQREASPTQSDRPAESSDVSSHPPKPSTSDVPEPPLVATEDLPKQVVSQGSEATSIPTNYPMPLAYAYRLADAEFETFRVLKELYRNAEGLTAFLASLTLALAPAPTGKRKDTVLRAWRGKGATFGSWYAILDKTTPTIDEEKGPLYRSMKGLLGTNGHPSSFADNMTWLIDRRNDLHHGDLPLGPRADRLVQEVRWRFEDCVSECAALWQHPLRLVLDYDAVRNKDYVVATCLDFSSDHPVGRKVQERYHGIPKKQDLYILQDGKKWISLYPFVSVHYCHHCNARETYFVDAWQGTGEEANLRSFERAHEETSEEIGQGLTLRLG